ncbi:hypothetical protein [Microbacterium sp.]|jgi:hypothetical protein|uniref:hypothetical protein n=1 Tax=Microbacterium sp. TaxID=51671 RepID=UPI0035AFE1E6
MRSTTVSRRLAAVTIAAAAVFGLTACTGAGPAASDSTGPSAGGQTTEEACRLVSDTITAATDEFEQATTEDPAAVADAFHAAAESIADASSQVTNEEVAAVLPSLQQLFGDVADLLPAIIEGDTSKAAEFEQMGADLQASMQEFDALCGSAE